MNLTFRRVVLLGLLVGLFLALAPGFLPTARAQSTGTENGAPSFEPSQRGGLVGGSLRPAPADCEARCTHAAERALAACLEKGGSQERCDAAAAQAKAECLVHCPGQNGGGDPCRGRCQAAAEAEKKACMDGGGTREECRARAEAVLARCLEHCRNTGTKPDPGRPAPDPRACQARCEESARKVFEACMAEGTGSTPPDPAHCRDLQHKALEECLTHCRNAVTPPDPGSCVSRCVADARATYEDCVAHGHDAEACRARANEMLEHCKAGCTGGGGGTVPAPGCDERCANHAREVLRACLAEGGAAERCEARAKEALETCLTECKGTAPGDCETECQRVAHEHYNACVANGHDEAECAARARRELAACLGDCS